ncbi:D-alanyl-D-alanine carboxypeptidase [Dyadobacter soli]|uniref:D-alanyl-D-alanine carboxypeptidase n=1 Tax=Dyadobacter soli TaxID=659014 RepID=A0A1G7G276_9BACT|nr:M15 family metallopeptidase [Dyadobacter soli]SDE82231.1 D-alanyl-D-alanine carboxypeptidase [Dyadobacter soli]
MKTQAQLIAKFGDPYNERLRFENKWMKVWIVPVDIREAIPAMPAKIYLNKLMEAPLDKALRRLISLGLHVEIKTWDGCFNIRKKRGSSGISAHAWGIAVDMNAATNPFKGKVTWSAKFLQVWRDIGWICGADWSAASKDGMHFQWEAS